MILQGRSFSGNERNCVFLNVEGGRFATVSAISGLDFPDDGRALALVDWDQDGDLDMWISNRNAPRLRFMRNDSTSINRFVAFQLLGNGTTTNRDAIGARVELVADALNGRPMIKALRAGEGFLAQSTKWLYFGLGDIDAVDKAIVHWPDGQSEEFSGIATNHRYQLVQGSGQAVTLNAPSRTLAVQEDKQQDASEPTPSQVRVPLVTLLPMPISVEYSDFQDRRQQLSFGPSDKAKLVVLWASWCAPCLTELAELVERQSELKDAGIDVVTLTVDGLGDVRGEPNAARDICDRLKLPFTRGKASEEFVQLMTGYHHQLVVLKELLPVPSSFLIDRDGRLSVIYKGRLDVDQLIADANSSPQTMQERLVRSAPLPGRFIDEPRLLSSQIRFEAKILTGMAKAFAEGGRIDDAKRLFEESLQSEPDYAEAHAGLARALANEGRYPEALTRFRRAIELEPDDTILHTGMGKLCSVMGRFDDALTHLAVAVQIEPANWDAELEWGRVLIAQKRFDEAETHLKRALELKPDLLPAREALQFIASQRASQ